eukprot:SAG11_NODE_714_length_7634_cov_4.848706_1_plen_46_part_00
MMNAQYMYNGVPRYTCFSMYPYFFVTHEKAHAVAILAKNWYLSTN